MGDCIRLIDTHVHINFEAFQGDIQQVAQDWRSAGVVRLVHSCVEPSEFPAIQALADQFPELSFAVGLHPLDVEQWSDILQETIAHLAKSDPRVVAIGETGLDLYKARNDGQQRIAFVAQLAIAHSMNLPVIIHCRDAAEPMLQILRQFWQDVGTVSGVMHCWTGSPDETEAFLDLGFYISFSGIVTFKNAFQVKESAKLVPGDRLLIETDCPFLSPVPKRSESRNQPAYVRYVAEYLAQLRGEPIEKIADQTTENACRLFSLSF